MASIIFSTTDSSTVKKVFFKYNQVKEIYYGNTLAWKDDDAQAVSNTSNDYIKFYSEIPLLTSETKPLGKTETKTSNKVDLRYEKGVYVTYSDNSKIGFITGDSNTNVGNLVFEGNKQDVVDTCYSQYTIPICDSVCGRTYTVKRYGDTQSEQVYEYQTSDDYALFGLSTDRPMGLNLSSARDSVTKSGTVYNVSSAGSILFRPLKNGQLNLEGSGYYFTKADAVTCGDVGAILVGEYSISELPTQANDLNQDTYSLAGFTSLPSSLQLIKGQAVLVGWFDSGTFSFSKLFNVDTSYVSIPKKGGSKTINIVTDDDTTWTASVDDNWISLSSASGTGSATLTISANQNSTGTKRTTTVILTSANNDKLYIAVNQDAYVEQLTFGSTSVDNYVLKETPDGWSFGDEEERTTGTTNDTKCIKVTPSVNGTITLSFNANPNVESCDPTIIGATISEDPYSYEYDSVNGVACCDNDSSLPYTVTANTDYYLWLNRSDTNSTSSYALKVYITFNAS